MAKFTSIFNKNTDVDANLSNLFNSKNETKVKKSQIAEKAFEAIVETENLDSESDNDNGIETTNKTKENTEERTIFVGNLHNAAKKEVLVLY